MVYNGTDVKVTINGYEVQNFIKVPTRFETEFNSQDIIDIHFSMQGTCTVPDNFFDDLDLVLKNTRYAIPMECLETIEPINENLVCIGCTEDYLLYEVNRDVL